MVQRGKRASRPVSTLQTRSVRATVNLSGSPVIVLHSAVIFLQWIGLRPALCLLLTICLARRVLCSAACGGEFRLRGSLAWPTAGRWQLLGLLAGQAGNSRRLIGAGLVGRGPRTADWFHW